jgi:hypothetical protein
VVFPWTSKGYEIETDRAIIILNSVKVQVLASFLTYIYEGRGQKCDEPDQSFVT